MKILAIPATNNPNGLNRRLINHAAELLEGGLLAGGHADDDGTGSGDDVEVEIIDLNDYEMPIYSTARQDSDGIPEPARRFFDKIGAADAVIVSFAEYNGSYTSAWKNVYDWASRIDSGVYQGKKVAMFAATPGPRGGAGVLGSATMTAPFFGAELVGSLGIPTFGENFDSEAGHITNPELADQFQKVLAALAD